MDLNGYTHLEKEGIKLSKHGRRSGGVVFYFKHKFKHGVHLAHSSNKFSMWVQLDDVVFGFDTDVYLGIIYIRPTIAQLLNAYYDEVEKDVVKYKSMGEVILTGDFNARAGSEADFIVNDDGSESFLALPHNYFQDNPMFRRNTDIKCDSHGKKFLDICRSNVMRILNGRIACD